MSNIQNYTKQDFKSWKFHHFSSSPKRKRCWRNAFSASENEENDHFIQDVGIQNFEVIYEEQVMDHIQKNTKHDLET
jgi:hypothetical protein